MISGGSPPPTSWRPGARRGGLLSDLLGDMRRLPGQVRDLFLLASRRLWASRRIFVGLQIGVIVAAAVAATIPLYSNGALMRLLASELKPQNDRPPGAVMLRYLHQSGDQFTAKKLGRLQAVVATLPTRAGIGTHGVHFYMASTQSSLATDSHSTVPEDPSVQRSAFLEAEVGFAQHIHLLAGKMYAAKLGPHGTYQAVVSQATERNLHVLIGQTYHFAETGLSNHINVRIVGIYQRLNRAGGFWPYQFENNNLVVSSALFQKDLMFNPRIPLEEATWYTVLRLSQLAPSNALHLISALEAFQTAAGQAMPRTTLAVSPLSELRAYAAQLGVMQQEMLLISLPILALTIYYIVMTAGLAISQERNEIAVLVSRGARTWQILSLYMAEWLIMGVVAIVLAPLPAALLTEIVGASTGFLSFVNRQPLALMPNAAMYEYAIVAAIGSLAAAMLPVWSATRQSIIGYKQDAARIMRAPVWRRLYLDLILGAVALYAWHTFSQDRAAAAAAHAGSFALSPLLYLVPAVFMAAAGLFFVRILPYVIRAVDALVGKYAPLPLVVAARQLARTPAQFSPLIFLLIFTVSLGYYSASAARTLNANLADALAYQTGSDISLYEVWAQQGISALGTSASSAGLESLGTSGGGSSSGAASIGASGTSPTTAVGVGVGGGGSGGLSATAGGGSATSSSATGQSAPLQFGGVGQAVGLLPGQTAQPSALLSGQSVAEPPFAPNLKQPGVLSAARVFLEKARVIVGGRTYPQAGQLMAIQPAQFYQTSWWRPDLSPYSFFAYMQALGTHYNGVLVSRSFLSKMSLQPGDSVSLALSGGHTVGSFEVLGPIVNWPGVYSSRGPIFVANWVYVENTFGVQPYYVWFKTKPTASVAAIVKGLEKSKLFATSPVDRRVLLGKAHAQPERTGSNGLLTIGFLVASLLTVLGYLLYAVLSLRSRLLQMGLLRAMGLTRGALSVAVISEQVFLLLAGIAGGLYVGVWTAYLYLPFFQSATGPAVPPFLVLGAGPDLLRMGVILAVLLGLAIAGLAQSLRGLRIGEAVKLGEE